MTALLSSSRRSASPSARSRSLVAIGVEVRKSLAPACTLLVQVAHVVFVVAPDVAHLAGEPVRPAFRAPGEDERIVAKHIHDQLVAALPAQLFETLCR